MNPKISVIIPTYGVPVFLNKAIQSVRAQTIENWELIIVDDNDPNTEARMATEALVSNFQEIDKRIIYIKHERNKNGAVARNTGFAIAKGKYISLLDSDDEYYPNRLELCSEALDDAETSVAGVYTGCEFRRNNKTYFKYLSVESGNFTVQTLACTFMFCSGSNIFVRKRVVDELNGFDGEFLRHQDYEFLVRLFRKYTLLAIPQLLLIKNQENFNLPNVEKQIDIKIQYLSKFDDIISNLSRKDQDYIYRKNFISIAENAMAQKKYNLAKEYYHKARLYGSLTCREFFRCLVFPIYTLIRK